MEKNELHIIYGDNSQEMVNHLLKKIKIEQEIKKGMLIGIKPNLVLASPAENGATTSPKIVEGVVSYLNNKGFYNIIILESSWVGAETEQAFKVCGYDKISQKYNLPLVDLKKDSYQKIKADDLELKICKKALAVDYLINIPVLKAHCQTLLTCALKNLKGCIPDSEKRRFHTLGLSKPIAYLNKILKSDLVIVDGLNGDLTFEEGGTPVAMNRIIVGKDPVLVDSYAANLLGYSSSEIAYLALAEKIAVGSSNLKQAKFYEYQRKFKGDINVSLQVEKLAQKIVEKNACSPCYGSLIHALQRIEEQGDFKKLNKVYIGQGFKGKTKKKIGIGDCTNNFNNNVKGCPPLAKDIVSYLENII